MICPNCGTELPERAKFCLECGQPVSAQVVAQPRFGSPEIYTPRHLAEKILTSRSALEGERKQVTVLFCDLVDSTPLAERLGPEGMHVLLNRFFELALAEVHRYEGTINQFLGDGFMALFGAPVAHEDHARRASLAAVMIRRGLAERRAELGLPDGVEVKVRMGINTGLVVVGGIGDNLRMDYTAIGDTTNVAARLQQVAAPGTTLISEATARLVQQDARLEPVTPVTVKGKQEPVRVFTLAGWLPRRSVSQRAAERASATFVGRERELGELQAAFADIEAGCGHAVSVVGEAGAGKSRLVYEFRRGLEGRDVTFLEGRCRSYGKAIPYLPILDVVRDACGLTDFDAPATVTWKIRDCLADRGLAADESTPYVLNLLGIKEGAARLADFPAEAVKRDTIDVLRGMILGSTRHGPLVLIVEDLHWIDDPSQDYLAALVGSLARSSILFIVTCRPEYRPPWTQDSCSTEIVLPPLSAEQSRAMVQAHHPLPDALVDAILAKADGNPLFLEELTRTVGEHPELGPDLTIPDTIQGVLMARIDRLPEPTKRLLQTAAVLGREFSRRLLDAIWHGPGDANALLAELVGLELLHDQSTDDEPGLTFTHGLTQEVAYESLLIPHRQALHAAVGAALERLYTGRLEQAYGQLAHHYARTEHAEKAVEYLTRLAESAARSYANAVAVQSLEEARRRASAIVDEGVRDRLSIDLVLRESQSLFLLGRFEESLALLLEEADRVRRIGDCAVTAQFHVRLASTYGVLGDSARAVADATRALEYAERAADDAVLGKAHYQLAREYSWLGRLTEGLDHGRRAVTLLDRAGERWWLSLAHWSMAVNYQLLGDFDAALEAAAWSQAVGETIGDDRQVSAAAWTTGWIHATRGDWETGLSACARSLERAPDPVTRALATGFLGYAYLEKGDVGEALPRLETAIRAFTGFNFPQLQGLFSIFEAQARFVAGDLAIAVERARNGLALAHQSGFSAAIGVGHRILAAVARAEGHLADAESHLGSALAIGESAGASFEVARTHLALAEVTHDRGDERAAARHLSQAYRLFEKCRAPKYLQRTREVAASLGASLAA